MQVGLVNALLNDVFEFKKLNGPTGDTKKNIIKLQLAIKTGLSLSRFTAYTADSSEDVIKIVSTLKNPEFGLIGFPFEKYMP